MSMETVLERSFSSRSIGNNVELKSRLRTCAKACSVPIIILLVIAALGPEKWAPRTHLGWQFDHFIGYFGITLFFCFGWPRPFVVGAAFMALAALLECLQAFTPDRSAYLPAIFYGGAGALMAALVAELFIRAWRLHVITAIRCAQSSKHDGSQQTPAGFGSRTGPVSEAAQPASRATRTFLRLD